MSLFVGNIARDVNERDLGDEFDRISPCEFKFKVSASNTLQARFLPFYRGATHSSNTKMIVQLSKPSRN